MAAEKKNNQEKDLTLRGIVHEIIFSKPGQYLSVSDIKAAAASVYSTSIHSRTIRFAIREISVVVDTRVERTGEKKIPTQFFSFTNKKTETMFGFGNNSEKKDSPEDIKKRWTKEKILGMLGTLRIVGFDLEENMPHWIAKGVAGIRKLEGLENGKVIITIAPMDDDSGFVLKLMKLTPTAPPVPLFEFLVQSLDQVVETVVKIIHYAVDNNNTEPARPAESTAGLQHGVPGIQPSSQPAPAV